MNRRFIESNTRPLVRGAVGLHAAFTVSDATIKAAGELARELGVPIHVHVAEDVCDRDGFRRLRDALVPGSMLLTFLVSWAAMLALFATLYEVELAGKRLDARLRELRELLA